ncbi:uncharacterized protein LOC133192881 [Saccostrea echinata]|uniref:uncharacterized protein LOC133192881 n=1 Tax=Saccostrea echinata TaxID=191078 RepID=UPI002A80C629|nr:uncharacterized protein LOC133192881 [Saccostrea echinata]
MFDGTQKNFNDLPEQTFANITSSRADKSNPKPLHQTESSEDTSFQKTEDFKKSYASITASGVASDKTEDEKEKDMSRKSPSRSSCSDIENFMEYVNNFQRGHFILFCSKLSNLKYVEAISLVRWLCVFDFDENSRSDGMLSRIEDKIRERRPLHVCTWKDTPQLSHKGTQWCLLRGSVQEAESRTPSDYKSWMANIRQDYEKHLNEITKFSDFTTLKAVVFWPNDENIQFMFWALLKMVEILGIDVILCDHLLNQSTDEQSFLKIIQPNFVIKQPLQDIFRHMSVVLNANKNCSQKQHVYQLPTADGTNNPGIDDKMAADLREDLHVLYLNNPYQRGSEEDFSLFDLEEEEKNFLRGGNLHWFAFYEAGVGHFAAERDLTKLIVERIKTKYIDTFKSGKITVFHEPGSGGTTLGQQILWSLRTETPCLQVEMNMTSTVPSLINRIEVISKKTNLPLVLLIDGDDRHKVKGLYNLVNHLMVIFIHIRRLIVKPKTISENEFWLPGKVSRQEVKKLAIKFTCHCDSDLKKDKITDLVKDVERGKLRLMYEFGMTVFMEDFRGIHSYVKGYLQLDENPQHDRELQPWQKILGYLSLVYYYGQTSIPCQFFVTLLCWQNNYDVGIEDFPFQVRQFIVSCRFEGKPNCIRICHYVVAKEILEQLLTWRKRKLQKDEKTSKYGLSHTAKMGMYDFVIHLLDDIRNRKIKTSVKSGRITDILTRTLIVRYNRDVEDNELVRGRISRLLEDIPCKAPFTERINILKKITEIFPSDPNFHAHLGRMYSICRPEDEKKAEDCFATAVNLVARMKEISDFDESKKLTMKYVYHMYGIFCNQKITKLTKKQQLQAKAKLAPEDFDRIMETLLAHAKDACLYFSKTRAITLYGFEDGYGYVGEMTTRLLICEFVHRQTFFKDLNEVYTHRVEMVDFVKESITIILELIYQCYSCVNPDDLHVEFLRKIHWYNALFESIMITYDLDNLMKTENVHTRRVHNAVTKLQFGVESTLHTLDCITSASSINEIVRNCEKNFKDLTFEDIDLKRAAIDLDYKDWLHAIRHKKFVQIYSLEDVLLQVRFWHELLKSPSSKLYLFILLSVLGFGDIEESNPRIELLTEAKEILEDLTKIGRTISRQRSPKEWLGRGPGIRCLIPARFDYKACETEDQYYDSEYSDRVVLKGTICRPNEKRQTGFIELDLGDNITPIRIHFVPIRTIGPLIGKRYAGERVEFVLAFTYASGYNAFNVALLKKYPCVCSRMVEITSDKRQAQCLCGEYVSREDE